MSYDVVVVVVVVVIIINYSIWIPSVRYGS
jgi:hypothetical protein